MFNFGRVSFYQKLAPFKKFSGGKLWTNTELWDYKSRVMATDPDFSLRLVPTPVDERALSFPDLLHNKGQ